MGVQKKYTKISVYIFKESMQNFRFLRQPLIWVFEKKLLSLDKALNYQLFSAKQFLAPT